MNLVDFRFKNFWRDILAPIVAVICLATILYIAVTQLLDRFDGGCEFCPITIRGLELEPDEIRVGDIASLIDGLCSSHNEPLSAQIYLGAESVGTSTFTGRNIDLLTRDDGSGSRIPATDSPEGRIRTTLNQGCTATEPIIARLPATFTPGQWRLRAHIVVTGPQGQMQDIVAVSDEFTVLP